MVRRSAAAPQAQVEDGRDGVERSPLVPLHAKSSIAPDAPAGASRGTRALQPRWHLLATGDAGDAATVTYDIWHDLPADDDGARN